MIQCKPPVAPWCNNLSLAGKRPVRIQLPLIRIQYLRGVLGFRSAGHIQLYVHTFAEFILDSQNLEPSSWMSAILVCVSLTKGLLDTFIICFTVWQNHNHGFVLIRVASFHLTLQVVLMVSQSRKEHTLAQFPVYKQRLLWWVPTSKLALYNYYSNDKMQHTFGGFVKHRLQVLSLSEVRLCTYIMKVIYYKVALWQGCS